MADWTCKACTFIHSGPLQSKYLACSICGTVREDTRESSSNPNRCHETNSRTEGRKSSSVSSSSVSVSSSSVSSVSVSVSSSSSNGRAAAPESRKSINIDPQKNVKKRSKACNKSIFVSAEPVSSSNDSVTTHSTKRRKSNDIGLGNIGSGKKIRSAGRQADNIKTLQEDEEAEDVEIVDVWERDKDSEDDDFSNILFHGSSLLSLTEFQVVLDQTVVKASDGRGWKALDSSNWIKTGGTGAGLSGNEQWGRALPDLVDEMRHLCNLQPRDVFVDVGSGCGQVVLQVAATIGCESHGIEVMEGRHYSALQIRELFCSTMLDRIPSDVEVEASISSSSSSTGEASKSPKSKCPTYVRSDVLRQINGNETNSEGGGCGCFFHIGSFESPEHAARILRADVVFVNNAEGIFSTRRGGGRDLNASLARLMCRMKIGSRVLTLDPIESLASLTDVLTVVESDGQIAATSAEVLSSSSSSSSTTGLTYNPDDHQGAFTLVETKSSRGACSWREESMNRQDMYVYEKRRNKWRCKCCGWNNELKETELRLRSESGGERGDSADSFSDLDIDTDPFKCLAFREGWQGFNCTEQGRAKRRSTRNQGEKRRSAPISFEARFDDAMKVKLNNQKQTRRHGRQARIADNVLVSATTRTTTTTPTTAMTKENKKQRKADRPPLEDYPHTDDGPLSSTSSSSSSSSSVSSSSVSSSSPSPLALTSSPTLSVTGTPPTEALEGNIKALSPCNQQVVENNVNELVSKGLDKERYQRESDEETCMDEDGGDLSTGSTGDGDGFGHDAGSYVKSDPADNGGHGHGTSEIDGDDNWSQTSEAISDDF